MIRCRIQIGSGGAADTYDRHGLIYMEADKRFEAPARKHDVSSYAEYPGENADPRTVQDAFDYTVVFLVEAPNRNLENANARIAAFNRQLYSVSPGSEIRTMKTVTFYDDYKRCKIVGLPSLISEAKEFYRRQDGSSPDCVLAEFKIRVTDPSLCDFDLALAEAPVSITFSLRTDTLRQRLFADVSGDTGGAQLRFLSRGRARIMEGYSPTGHSIHKKSRHRWHSAKRSRLKLHSKWTPRIMSDGEIRLNDGDVTVNSELGAEISTEKPGRPVVRSRKSSGGCRILPLKSGVSWATTFGFAFYDGRGKRVSAVRYFRKNYRVESDLTVREWLTVT